MSSNKQRREEAMSKLEREIKARDRQEKTKPLGVVIASIVVILAVVGAILYFATRNSGDHDTNASAKESATTSSTTSPADKTNTHAVLDGKRATPLADTVSCQYTPTSPDHPTKNVGTPPTDNVKATGTVNVTLNTNDGAIPLTLNRAASPCAVNALTFLASKNYFDQGVCHRLTTAGIKVLQCGDPSGTGAGGPGFSFKDEYPVDEMAGKEVTYPRGSIAMANSGANTNGSQFFLNYGDSPLAANYTYVGTIGDEGMKTLAGIAAKGTANGSPDGAPKERVVINSVTVSE